MTFAEKLLRLRRREGLSQEALADALGVSRQAVSRWEQGTALPDGAKLLPCARYFGVSADWMLDEARGWEDQTEQPSTEAPALRGSEVVSGRRDRHRRRRHRLVVMGILSAVFPAVVSEAPAGVDWGPCLHRSGRLFEAARRGVGSSPCGRQRPWRGCGCWQQPALRRREGIAVRSPAGTPPGWRQPCTASVRPPGTSAGEDAGSAPAGPLSGGGCLLARAAVSGLRRRGRLRPPAGWPDRGPALHRCPGRHPPADGGGGVRTGGAGAPGGAPISVYGVLTGGRPAPAELKGHGGKKAGGPMSLRLFLFRLSQQIGVLGEHRPDEHLNVGGQDTRSSAGPPRTPCRPAGPAPSSRPGAGNPGSSRSRQNPPGSGTG